ncbi:MAG: response regulator [Flavipsychrobacter sp.]|nr:response regulator [Flavipsychrobacter sp.]
MAVNNIRRLSKGTQLKIVAAFVLGCAAILLSVSVTRHSFATIATTVDELSHPDPQVRLVNNILRHVVVLDQAQRQLVFDPRSSLSRKVVRETDTLQALLNELQELNEGDGRRLAQVDSMKQLLKLKNRMFADYMLLRTDLVQNDTMLRQIQTLSERIYNPKYNKDTNVVTSARKITTTIVASDTASAEEQRETLWNRLFGKRKPMPPRKVQTLIQEELNITIDTLAMIAKDSTVERISQAIRDEVVIRISKRNRLIERQLDMIDAGNQLVNRLLAILRQIESEETRRQEEKNNLAADVIATDMDKLDKLLVLFIAGSALLGYRIFIDIVRSNRYRRELQVAKDAAEEASVAKQRFLSNISHELRTPLQTIVGVSEQATLRGEARTEELNVLHYSSQHLLQIVNEVLDYSQIVSGKFALEERPFHLGELLKEVYAMTKILADRKGLELLLETGEETDGYYLGDAFRLRQVLLNLLGNAVKYTAEGNVTLSVSGSRRRASAAFVFSVRDTGVGISEADMGRIFEQFGQARERGAMQEGTGLGLNIVQALVRAQKGTIDVQSQPGQGSEFIVRLVYPYASAPAVVAPGGIAPAAVAGVKVMIVDDDALIRELCSGIMKKYGIPHVLYASPEAVLEAGVANDITTVLMDIRLPGMSGTELMQRLRASMSGARFVALTAQALPGEREGILEAGFDDLLMKPFMEHALISTIIGDNAPDVPPLIGDPGMLNLVAGDNPATRQRLLDTFVNETRKDLDTLQASLRDSDDNTSADILHRLAGRLGQMGATEPGLEARRLEHIFRTAPATNTIREITSEFAQDLERRLTTV